MSSLSGYKVILEDERKNPDNIGAVFLYPNKEKDYLNYFLLLLTLWEYMPSKTQIEELRAFILKYYKSLIIFIIIFYFNYNI